MFQPVPPFLRRFLLCAVVFTGACVSTDEVPCLAGARLCEGPMVLLCDPSTGEFVIEQTCPDGTSCLAGVCVSVGFEDAGTVADAAGDAAAAHDTRSTPDTVAPDVGGAPDGGFDADAGAMDADAGPDDVEVWSDDGMTDSAGAVSDSEVVDVLPTPTDTVTAETDGVETSDEVAPAVCGDGVCDLSEEGCETCPEDCGTCAGEPVCGDGVCESPESSTTCPEDCGEPGPAPGPDPWDPGMLVYEKVSHFIKGGFHRVRWHPAGEYALLLGTGGVIARYDRATGAVTEVTELGDAVVDLDVSHDGAFFLVAGTDDDESHLWRVVPDPEDPEVASVEVAAALTQGSVGCVVRDPDGPEMLVCAWLGNYIGVLVRWSEADGLIQTKVFNGSTLTDVMWGPPELFEGSRAVITAEDQPSPNSHTWYLTPDDVLDNGWGGGFGNAGRAGWRPGGTYGVVSGATSNNLYIFDGSWQSVDTAVSGSANLQGIAWRPTGTRALSFGRATGGADLKGTVVDVRAGEEASPLAITTVDASIPGFANPPWSADSNAYLLDADWRPADCDEGLVVGRKGSSNAYGYVIRFHDQDDDACDP